VERGLLRRIPRAAKVGVLAVLAAACALLVVALAVVGGNSPTPTTASAAFGRAIAPIEGEQFGMSKPNPLGVGQELTLLHVPLVNEATAPLVIERIEPLVDEQSASLADIVALAIAPRVAGQDGYAPGGVYLARPIVGFDPRFGCVPQPLSDPAAFRLAPMTSGFHALLAITIRGRRPGMYRMHGQRVIYMLDGKRYWQDLHFRYKILVSQDARRMGSADMECRNG
jgi:hypothetical protein